MAFFLLFRGVGMGGGSPAVTPEPEAPTTTTTPRRTPWSVRDDYQVWSRDLPSARTDYLVWDMIEQVTYTSTRNGGDARDVIDWAKRRALTKKELLSGNGAYLGEDLVWLIPQVKLAALLSARGQQGKPGDVIRDESGTEWTVLESSWIVFKSIWRFVCRNLVLVYDLQDRIDIQRPTISYPQGVKQHSWGTPYSNVPASVQPISADVAEERGIRGFRVTHTITVGRQLELTEDDRILFGGQYYEVLGYRNSDRLDLLMEIDAELVP